MLRALVRGFLYLFRKSLVFSYKPRAVTEGEVSCAEELLRRSYQGGRVHIISRSVLRAYLESGYPIEGLRGAWIVGKKLRPIFM